MERIKLAMERARRQAAASPVAAQGAAPGAAPGAVLPGAAAWTLPLRPDPGPGAVETVPADLLPLDPVHLERHRIVTLHQGNPLRQGFDLLRTQVLQRMDQHGWRTMAVTSPSTQSGKTVVAINLALSIAHHPSKSALLVDFDLRRPQVGAYLGLPQGDSLNEVLDGEATLAGAIVHAGIPRFSVLPTHRRVPGAGEVLASDRVSRLIATLRDGHPQRIVMFDLPPVTAVDDVIAVLPRVDCVLLVVGNGDSTRFEIEESTRHLARYNLLGVVVNKVPHQPLADGYY